MTHPTTRVLAMLELLQANQRLGGAALAQHLGVDIRTVRRYATRLADLGIPVVAERGRYGAYRLMPGYKLPPLMFTDDEAVAVLLGLQVGHRLGVPASAAESALAKVRRVLPAALRDRVEALQETLEFTASARHGAAPAADVVLTLAAAARDRRRVRLAYRSWRGADTERELDPYGLVLHAGRWYLTGLDHRSGQVRTFRVDRVLEVTAAVDTFEPPEGHEPARHVVRALASVPYAHPVAVELHCSLDEARGRIPASVATLTGTADGVLMSTSAERLDGMARMLAGLGVPFTIRHPAALRDAVRDLAASLARYAENAPG
ncbi:helix-turn-helix transcriptional regulator [Plantactinospora siamensis]|uniref:Helix-turn-helix transcriptional regulator n=1 Tax=Plantactinospora siamensis TaxID=555372 RepID=A0ABV6P3L9_9ACTN